MINSRSCPLLRCEIYKNLDLKIMLKKIIIAVTTKARE